MLILISFLNFQCHVGVTLASSRIQVECSNDLVSVNSLSEKQRVPLLRRIGVFDFPILENDEEVCTEHLKFLTTEFETKFCSDGNQLCAAPFHKEYIPTTKLKKKAARYLGISDNRGKRYKTISYPSLLLPYISSKNLNT